MKHLNFKVLIFSSLLLLGVGCQDSQIVVANRPIPAIVSETTSTPEVAETSATETAPSSVPVEIDKETSANLEAVIANTAPSVEVQATVVNIPVVVEPPKPTTETLVPQSAPKPIPVTNTSAPNGTYTNVYGNTVPTPYAAPSAPAGATAQCRDGTYSFSQSRRGTCSHHGGVDEWL